jgi:hypothetical protein
MTKLEKIDPELTKEEKKSLDTLWSSLSFEEKYDLVNSAQAGVEIEGLANKIDDCLYGN